MNCQRVALPGGGVAIVCGVRRGRRTSCVHCGQPAAYECDVCDRPLCRSCRIHVPPDQDFCKGHRKQAQAAAAQLRLNL
jgi:hypothetical protein